MKTRPKCVCVCAYVCMYLFLPCIIYVEGVSALLIALCVTELVGQRTTVELQHKTRSINSKMKKKTSNHILL